MKKENRGDIPCGNCKTKDNPVWFTDNVFWNNTVGNDAGILCINCFIDFAMEKYEVVAWRLIPEFRKTIKKPD